MLYPRVHAVSPRGQIVLSPDIRRAVSIGKLVLVIPKLTKREIVIQPISGGDAIEAGLGMLAGGDSLVGKLLKEKKGEGDDEAQKYAKLRS